MMEEADLSSQSSSSSSEGDNDDHLMNELEYGDQTDSTTEEEDNDDDGFDHDNEDDPIRQLLAAPNPHKDVSMKITDQERTWALEIKHAVEESEDIQCLQDMEYAHYAIICQGDIEDALRRIHGIQCFQQTYNVDNTPTQGVECIEELLIQQPAGFLYLDVDPITLQGFHAFDAGAFDFELALTKTHPKGVEYNWKILVVGMYYCYLAVQPTLQSVRAGHMTMGDFIQFRFETRHINAEFQTRYASEMFCFYPLRFDKYLAFNTGYAANVAWGMIKKVFPPSLIKVLQLGCKIPLEEGDNQEEQLNFAPTLSDKYLRPTMQAAYSRLLLRAKDLLQLRQRNQSLFRL